MLNADKPEIREASEAIITRVIVVIEFELLKKFFEIGLVECELVGGNKCRKLFFNINLMKVPLKNKKKTGFILKNLLNFNLKFYH